MTATPAGLEGRAFVVTAAGSGIGRALVGLLLEAGAHCVGMDFSGRRLAESRGEWEQRTPDTEFDVLKRNVTEPQSAADGVALALDRWGRLDGVANIAGGIIGFGEEAMDVDLRRIELQSWRDIFALNVDSAFLLTQAALPAFEEASYGKVVNVASLAAWGNLPGTGNTSYDAAKAAVIGMTRSLGRSLGPLGVRVNAVAPGPTLSTRVRESLDPTVVRFNEERTPLQRVGVPEDVARVARFLLSPESDHVSGEVIRVAGGLR